MLARIFVKLQSFLMQNSVGTANSSIGEQIRTHSALHAYSVHVCDFKGVGCCISFDSLSVSCSGSVSTDSDPMGVNPDTSSNLIMVCIRASAAFLYKLHAGCLVLFAAS